MKKLTLLIPCFFLVFSTVACSFTVNLPKVKIGEVKSITIAEPVPQDPANARVEIDFGAGTLEISGGSEYWVGGEIRTNIGAWEPKIIREDNWLQIKQDHLGDIRIPDKDIINEWKLVLGNVPCSLSINAGGYKGTINLSGVPITDLSIADGASQATVTFETLNPAQMNLFNYRTGASEVNLYNLSNSNVDSFVFEGGTGSYTLDFSGQLQRDMHVTISTGVSDLEIIIPEGIPARVSISGGLNNVSAQGTWTISNNVYEKDGDGPLINIIVEMGLANLNLISR